MKSSIIILTYNQLDVATKPCIESLYKYTDVKDFELIVVDNNSNDGTQEYLKELKSNYDNVKIILNEENKGFPAGNNQGIKVADGEFIVLLNNDTLLTPNWLNSLIKKFDIDERAGLVGPISNSVGNEQCVYLENLAEYNYLNITEEYVKKHKNTYFETKLLGFFCVAIKKEVIEKIGYLEEAFTTGTYEDNDFCLRAQKNGYKLLIAEDSFVYHKGSISFKTLPSSEFNELVNKNKEIFYSKHNIQFSYIDNLSPIWKRIKKELINFNLKEQNPDIITERILNRLNSFENIFFNFKQYEQGLTHSIKTLEFKIEELEKEIKRLKKPKLQDLISMFPLIGPVYSIFRKFFKDLKIARKEFFKKLEQSRYNKKHLLQLNEILSKNKYKGIIIYPPTLDWNIPLFQRPQHIALQLARKGYLFFFCTNNDHYDKVDGFQEVETNLYLTDRFDLLIKKLNKGNLLFHAANPFYSLEDLKDWKKRGFDIIYDYVDEIDEDIIGKSNLVINRHLSVDENILDLILTTATKLYNEMNQRFNNTKVLLNQNAVEYEHFQVTKMPENCPEDIEILLQENKPIIGYYGALAKWIDYDLLVTLADKRSEYNIVLIGWNYDGSLVYTKERENIKYLGVKEYSELPKYGIWFDIGIIPFKEGNIAQATSPLKLFEYMAMKKPVVVTRDLLECIKFDGIFVAQNKYDFIEKVDEALKVKNDPKYIEILDNQAQENTWIKRAEDIDEYLNKKALGVK